MIRPLNFKALLVFLGAFFCFFFGYRLGRSGSQNNHPPIVKHEEEFQNRIQNRAISNAKRRINKVAIEMDINPPAGGGEFERDFETVSNFPPKSCPQKYGKVAFFVVYTNYSAYGHATNLLRCYAISRNYSYILVQPFQDPLVAKKCSSFGDIFFRKHCAAAAYLNSADWLIVTDGDTAIINSNHCIEDFIDPEAEVIHYERFFSGEIASGNYIVKNTVAARRYLLAWARFEQQQPAPPVFTSADNGALHLIVLRAVFPTKKRLHARCLALLHNSTWPDYEPGYGKYVACTKTALLRFTPSASRAKVKVKILARGQAWVRDTAFNGHHYWHGDYMAHGIKTEGPFDRAMLKRIGVLANSEIPDECRDPNWQPEFQDLSLLWNQEQMGRALASAAVSFQNSRLKPVYGTVDMSRCWPKCPLVLDLPR